MRRPFKVQRPGMFPSPPELTGVSYKMENILSIRDAKMFPSPPEVIGVSYKTKLETIIFERRFPYPPEVTGVSYWNTKHA